MPRVRRLLSVAECLEPELILSVRVCVASAKQAVWVCVASAKLFDDA